MRGLRTEPRGGLWKPGEGVSVSKAEAGSTVGDGIEPSGRGKIALCPVGVVVGMWPAALAGPWAHACSLLSVCSLSVKPLATCRHHHRPRSSPWALIWQSKHAVCPYLSPAASSWFLPVFLPTSVGSSPLGHLGTPSTPGAGVRELGCHGNKRLQPPLTEGRSQGRVPSSVALLLALVSTGPAWC